MSDMTNMIQSESNQTLNLPQEEYEPILAQPAEMSLLEEEITISAFDIGGDHVFKTCYGDIKKIVDALRDYIRMLEMSCNTWDLQGFHRALFEIYAQELRKIADKFQAGIGYDYDATLENCNKKAQRKSRKDDPGGDALELALMRRRQKAEKNGADTMPSKSSEGDLTLPDDLDDADKNGSDLDDPWSEDL